MTKRSTLAFTGLAATALLVVWHITLARRPAWFTCGGPLRAATEQRPAFAPAYWKRACLGWSWTEQRPEGPWLICAGLQRGKIDDYRELYDREPWQPLGINWDLRAADIADAAGRGGYPRGAILAWKRDTNSDNALIAATNGSGQWLLLRAGRTLRVQFAPWREWLSTTGGTGSQILSHRPSNTELSRFMALSRWTKSDLQAPVTDWRVESWAFAWATGSRESPGFLDEVERMKSYRADPRDPTAVLRAKATRHFELLPGRSTVLRDQSLNTDACAAPSRPQGEGTWEPSASDVSALESNLYRLNPMLVDETVPGQVSIRSVNDYYRQYRGVLVQGQQYIFVSAVYHSAASENWQSVPFCVFDGGYVAFSAVFAVSSQTFFDFRINGSA